MWRNCECLSTNYFWNLVYCMNGGTLKIYALAVCFSSLMCGAIASGFFLFNTVKLIAPEATVDPNTLKFYGSSGAFRVSSIHQSATNRVMVAGPSGEMLVPPALALSAPPQTRELSDEELEKRRVEQYQNVLANHRFRARQGIILQTIIMLICAGLFFSHWRLVKKLSRD